MNPDQCAVTQVFGGNANPSYAGIGLKGHPGEDAHCGLGTPGHSPYNMDVYKVLTAKSPARDGSGFTGIFGIVDNGIECFEFLIGHCDPLIPVVAGNDVVKVKKMDLIYTEANHGLVYQDGVQITLAMQAAGDHRGSHRHYQKRPVQKVKQTQLGEHYLDCYSDNPAGTFYRDAEGFYYKTWDYSNGYNGCVDPTKSVFLRDLKVGCFGYDVFCLQNILVKEGCASFAPTGYFGTLTLVAMKKLQDKVGILPDAGYFGPKTRAVLQAKYNL